MNLLYQYAHSDSPIARILDNVITLLRYYRTPPYLWIGIGVDRVFVLTGEKNRGNLSYPSLKEGERSIICIFLYIYLFL
jgi:hypothetical protein